MMATTAEQALGGTSYVQADTRATFLVRTYLNLFMAVAAFAIFESILFTTGWARQIMAVIPLEGAGWLAVLAVFAAVGGMASGVAHRAHSMVAQYAALGAYVVAESVIFVPMIWFARELCPDAIPVAAAATGVGFTGLTLVAFITRKNFSFLRAFLAWAGLCAMALIIYSCLFGAELGPMFSWAMIAVAGVAILHDTSEVLHSYDDDQHVGAALELFASVALMFWYILRLFLQRD
jgi:FtsH-binding integral membrane protein